MNLKSLKMAPSQMVSDKLFYRPDIDGLRALAVLLVIAFHFFGVRGGFVGVDIFFVISGYLITSILLKELQLGEYTLYGFYARRVKRIFPALLLVLGASLIAGWFVLLAHEYQLLGKHVLAGATFSSNIVLWLESGYFDKESHLKPLLHLWSLGVEEQFYIFWPLILAWCYRRSWSIGFALLSLGLCSFLLNLYVSSVSSVTAFYWLPTRGWQLLAGAAIAYMQLRYSAPYQTWLEKGFRKHILGLLGLLLILICASQLRSAHVYPGYWAIFPTLGAFLLISSGPLSWINHYFFARRWMVAIGLISYPLYLWHWPLISFARIMGNGEVTRSVKIICFLLSLALAYLTYALIEKRIKTHSSQKIIKKLVMLLIFFGGLGVVVNLSGGMSNRYPDKEKIYQSFKSSDERYLEDVLNNPCERRFMAQDYLGVCQKSSIDQLPDSLLIGDSHAISSYPGLAYHYQQANRSLMMIARGACVPLIGVETHRRGEPDVCKKIMTEIYDFGATENNIKNIIITFRGPWYLHGGGRSYDKKEINPILLKELSFEEGIKKTYQVLDALGKRMIVYIDIPELDFLPEDCMDLRPVEISRRNLNTSCSTPYKKAYEISREFRDRLNIVKKELPNLIIFDAFEQFCDESRCYAQIGDKMLYEDGNHLSNHGSMHLGQKFFEINKNNLK